MDEELNGHVEEENNDHESIEENEQDTADNQIEPSEEDNDENLILNVEEDLSLNQTELNETDDENNFKNRKLLGKSADRKNITVGVKPQKVVQIAVPVTKKMKKDDLKVEVVVTPTTSKPSIKKPTDESKENNNKKEKASNTESDLYKKILDEKKVGFDYRYRVSKFKNEYSKNPDILTQNYNKKKEQKSKSSKETSSHPVEFESDELKPKVGFEYRYRISKFIEAGGNVTENVELNKLKKSKEHDRKSINLDKKSSPDESEDSSFLVGRYKIDKSKIGDIGFKYRYRVSNKLKDQMFDKNKAHKHKNKYRKAKNDEEKPIVEVLEYTDDSSIPYCDELADEEDLNVEEFFKRVRVIPSSKEKKQKQIAEPKHDTLDSDKPKAGFEYRYRISKMLQDKDTNKQKEPLSQAENQDATPEYTGEKPKVGFEHRYRVSKYLADKKSGNWQQTKAVPRKAETKKKQEKQTEAENTAFYDPESKPKVGFEYRYRISRYLAADKSNEKKTVTAKIEPKKSHGTTTKKPIEQHTIKPAAHKDLKKKTSEAEPVLSEDSKPKVGFEYRYRISKFLADPNSKLKKVDKISSAKVEVKKNNKEISSKKISKEETVSNEDKPKVGFAYRYRISKYLADPNRPKLDKQDPKTTAKHGNKKEATTLHHKKSEKQEPIVESTEPKLKVGFQYRYRISKFLADPNAKIEDLQKAESTKKHAKKEDKKQSKSQEKESDWVEVPKPQVGFEYRYRISKFLSGDRKPDTFARKQEKKVEKEEEYQAPYEGEKPEKVGYEYRYRVTKMLNSEKPDAIKKVERHDEEENQNNQAENIEKPEKVGFEYRYRVTKMLNSDKPVEIKQKEQVKVEKKKETEEPTEDKPDAGFEHRYRISKMLQDQASGIKKPVLSEKKKEPVRKTPEIEKKEDEITIDKPKVGFEHRYRVSKMVQDTSIDEKEKIVCVKNKEKEIKPTEPTPIQTKTTSQTPKFRKSATEPKKTVEQPTKKVEKVEQKPVIEDKKHAGWEHRYRVQKMQEAESLGLTKPKNEKADAAASKKSEEKKEQPIDNPNTGKVGYEFRYRVNKKAEDVSSDSNKKVDKVLSTQTKTEVKNDESDKETDEETTTILTSNIRNLKKKIKSGFYDNKPYKPVFPVLTNIDKDPQVVYAVEYKKIRKNEYLIRKHILDNIDLEKLKPKIRGLLEKKKTSNDTDENLKQQIEKLLLNKTKSEQKEKPTKINIANQINKNENDLKINKVEQVKEETIVNNIDQNASENSFGDDVSVEEESKDDEQVEAEEQKLQDETETEDDQESETETEIDDQESSELESEENDEASSEYQEESNEQELASEQSDSDAEQQEDEEQNTEESGEYEEDEESTEDQETQEDEQEPQESDEENEDQDLEDEELSDDDEEPTEIRINLNLFEAVKSFFQKAPSIFDLEELAEEDGHDQYDHHDSHSHSHDNHHHHHHNNELEDENESDNNNNNDNDNLQHETR